jgi:SCY1-like protein 1
VLSWLTSAASTSKLAVEIGEKVEVPHSTTPWWSVHRGVRKSDSAAVSVFVHDLKAQSKWSPLARNAFKRAKTVRHPYVLGWLDGEETPDRLVVVTEAVRALSDTATASSSASSTSSSSSASANQIAWGLYQVASALAFFNDSSLVHGNVNVASIFVTLGGDWKVSGLDFLGAFDDGAQSLLVQHSALVPTKFTPPELAQSVGAAGQWSAAPSTASAIDSWQLGCLIREAFGGPIRATADLRDMAAIPKELQSVYQKLLAGQAPKRLKPKALLDAEFFNNNYVKACLFLENLAIKDAYERDSFFKSLPTFCEDVPQSCRRYKLLPELLKSVEFAGAGNWHLLAALLKVADQLPDDEYAVKIAPVIGRYFECNDRALRVALLQNLNLFMDKLSAAFVNDKLFPLIASGFGDSSAQLRELTVKSMLLVVPKLAALTIDTHVLKQFAKLQVDREPGIRTNTTICLGRIAPNLTAATRDKVLAAAFARALRDPFAPGRMAGLAALCATMRFYDAASIATKVIPAISGLGVDPDEGVREKVFASLRLFVDRLEKLAASGGAARADSVEETAAAEKESAGMLGWLSKRIYGAADGAAAAASAPTAPATPSAAPAAKPSAGAAKTVPAAQAPALAPAPKTTSAAPPKSGGDGWAADDADELDIDLPDDDDDNNVGAVAEDSRPKKKSPYIGEDDDFAPTTSAAPKTAGDGWNEEFDVDDDDDEQDDGRWSFTPAKVVSTTTAMAGAKPRKAGKLAD